MTKPLQKTEYERKSVYINVSLSPILKSELEQLVNQGYFSNVSDAVRYAIHDMLAKFRAEGKLKPKKPPETAEERVKNATYAGSKEVEVD
jgi:Arc/MetJ-type ribon-helix-helix transcriptional regulator